MQYDVKSMRNAAEQALLALLDEAAEPVLGVRHTRFDIRCMHAAVGVPFSSLLVQRDQWDTYWGPKQSFF